MNESILDSNVCDFTTGDSSTLSEPPRTSTPFSSPDKSHETLDLTPNYHEDISEIL